MYVNFRSANKYTRLPIFCRYYFYFSDTYDKDLIYTLQPHKKNSKQTSNDTGGRIDVEQCFSWKVAVRYIGEAESERKGDLYRSTYFDTLYIRYRMRIGGDVPSVSDEGRRLLLGLMKPC